MANETLIAASLALGGQARLARAVGVRPPTVNQWIKGKRPVPKEKCQLIELATEGACTVEALLPGTSWTRVPDPTWPHVNGRPLVDVNTPVRFAISTPELVHA